MKGCYLWTPWRLNLFIIYMYVCILVWYFYIFILLFQDLNKAKLRIAELESLLATQTAAAGNGDT